MVPDLFEGVPENGVAHAHIIKSPAAVHAQSCQVLHLFPVLKSPEQLLKNRGGTSAAGCRDLGTGSFLLVLELHCIGVQFWKQDVCRMAVKGDGEGIIAGN